MEKIGNSLIESGRLLTMQDTGMEICLVANSVETICEARDDTQATSGSHRQRPLRVDGDGEYFQLYSPIYGEGFFFEIVERRGGYGGYGAANAQFRIAAQRRHLRPKGMPAR